ncbi:MAG: tRNA lysidine(34) synthetase TilS [Magnetococcus sp. YQC-9]
MPPSPHDPLLARFRKRAQTLISSTARLVVAVSGGVDSMALLHLLIASALFERSNLIVAHFDHALRPDSEEDAAFVRAQAESLGVTCHIGRWEAPQLGGNLQERARMARLEFLMSCARTLQADAIATAHHRDDQAETFLERLLRGSGVTGLAAMRSERPLETGIRLVRPLLEFGKKELVDWVTAHGVVWREDPSNGRTSYRRNLLRLRILPVLDGILPNRDAGGKLAATAEHLREADTALEWALARHWPRLDGRIRRDPPAITLLHAGVAELPQALLQKLFVRCHAVLTGAGHPPGARAVTLLARMIGDPRDQWHMHVSGMRIERVAARLRLQGAILAPRKSSQMIQEKEMWEMVEFFEWDPYHAAWKVHPSGCHPHDPNHPNP